MGIVKFVNKILYPIQYSSEAYINHMKNIGVKIGDNCHIFEPKSVNIDLYRPYLLEMGNNVILCAKTTILTHDYSHCVVCGKFGRNIGDAKPVKIGNNVFVGIDAMILMGTEIGSNVIIGAKSVVFGKIPDNCVVAGNPAKIICTIDEFFEKRIKNEVICAKNNVLLAKERLGRYPTIAEMGDAFAWLYLPRTEESIKNYPQFFNLPGQDSEIIKSNFLNVTTPLFMIHMRVFLMILKTYNFCIFNVRCL